MIVIDFELIDYLKRIFSRGEREVFHDGQDSIFSRRLEETLKCDTFRVLNILAAFVIADCFYPNVFSEMCRVVGRMETHRADEERLQLLELCLWHPNADVRDGAGLGIASLDDKRGYAAVKWAIERETVQWVKEGLQQVLEQLSEENKR